MLQVALHDQSFRPDPSSTRWRTPTKFEFVRDVAKWDGVAMFVDGHALTPDECDSPHKIAWLHEPPCLGEMHRVYNDIMHISHRYEKVLTYDARLLMLDPTKYHLQVYGGCWIDESDWGIHHKLQSRLCSMLVGTKNETAGHKLRLEIADKLAGLVTFYGARGVTADYSRGTKYRVNSPYRFTVITETCRMDNLLTEWLIDALAVGTVPIYWGCPNIDNFFDPRGILSFTTADECVDIVKSLSVKLYESMRPYISDNLALMRLYAMPDDQMFARYLSEYFQ